MVDNQTQEIHILCVNFTTLPSCTRALLGYFQTPCMRVPTYVSHPSGLQLALLFWTLLIYGVQNQIWRGYIKLSFLYSIYNYILFPIFENKIKDVQNLLQGGLRCDLVCLYREILAGVTLTVLFVLSVHETIVVYFYLLFVLIN